MKTELLQKHKYATPRAAIPLHIGLIELQEKFQCSPKTDEWFIPVSRTRDYVTLSGQSDFAKVVKLETLG